MGFKLLPPPGTPQVRTHHHHRCCWCWRNLRDRLRLRCRLVLNRYLRLFAFLRLGLWRQSEGFLDGRLDHLHALLAGDTRLAHGALADVNLHPYLEEIERQTCAVDDQRVAVHEDIPEHNVAGIGLAMCRLERRLLDCLDGDFDVLPLLRSEVTAGTLVEMDVAHRQLCRLTDADQLGLVRPGMAGIEPHMTGVSTMMAEHLAEFETLTAR